MELCEGVKRVQGQFAQAGALGQHPLLKLRRLAHREAPQKIIPVQGGGFLQAQSVSRELCLETASVPVTWMF